MLVNGSNLDICYFVIEFRNIPPSSFSLVRRHRDVKIRTLYLVIGIQYFCRRPQFLQKECKLVGGQLVILLRRQINRWHKKNFTVELFRSHHERNVDRFVLWLNEKNKTRRVGKIRWF